MPVRIIRTEKADKLFNLLRNAFATATIRKRKDESVGWFRRQLQSLLGVDRKKIVANAASNTRLEIGSMYMFFYQAKWDKKLPYWDKFPLMIPIEIYKDGFLGLNLHYLEPTLRARFLDKLLDFQNEPTLSDKSRMLMSYKMLATAARYKEFQPCVKRYLSSFLRSNMMKVEPKDWETAIFLPVEMFQKANKKQVWKDSEDKF
jgi:hypothetical protein